MSTEEDIKVDLNINRTIFSIGIGDIFMDNGSCTMLVTQKKFSGWSSYSPRLSIKMSKDIFKIFELDVKNKTSEFTGGIVKYYKVIGFKKK